MKDYEAMQEIGARIQAEIQVHKEAIEYHQDKITKLEATNVEDEFYLGNSEFPDYPGNEWMEEDD